MMLLAFTLCEIAFKMVKRLVIINHYKFARSERFFFSDKKFLI